MLFLNLLQGMLSCTTAEWLHAALFFTVASTFRSNGLMLAGYILWGMVVGPILEKKHVCHLFPKVILRT